MWKAGLPDRFQTSRDSESFTANLVIVSQRDMNSCRTEPVSAGRLCQLARVSESPTTYELESTGENNILCNMMFVPVGSA